MDYKQRYAFFFFFADETTVEELKAVANNEDEIFDRFYKELEIYN